MGFKALDNEGRYLNQFSPSSGGMASPASLVTPLPLTFVWVGVSGFAAFRSAERCFIQSIPSLFFPVVLFSWTFLERKGSSKPSRNLLLLQLPRFHPCLVGTPSHVGFWL